MGYYEYFRKIKANGNLLIFCQTTMTYFRCKNGDIRDGAEFGIFAVKSQFSS